MIVVFSPTKNQDGKQDPEIDQPQKGNQRWIHPGVDKDTGFFHSVVTIGSNVHDLMPAAEMLHSEERVVYATCDD